MANREFYGMSTEKINALHDTLTERVHKLEDEDLAATTDYVERQVIKNKIDELNDKLYELSYILSNRKRRWLKMH